MTMVQVAEGAGLHPNYAGSVERGGHNLSPFNLRRIADSLGLKVRGVVQQLLRPGTGETGEAGKRI